MMLDRATIKSPKQREKNSAKWNAMSDDEKNKMRLVMMTTVDLTGGYG